MSQRELPASQKPSLTAIAEAASEAAPRSPRFGKREFLDFTRLQALFLQEELERLRAKLYVENPDADENIQQATTAAELADLAEELESAHALNLRTLAASEGRLTRYDEAVPVGNGSLTVAWRTKGMGFGEVNFFVDGKGRLRVHNVGLGRNAIRAILLRLADEAILETE